ncbi:hypothetical protein DSO57_1011802 [Entomophthora muscae]|uniref:Uncharacterized protein n=1 Tax=Entomophthora muscae TaxID=34485 RepID=A0ACC2UFL1_9FUNG|nr:hypothetical protein DSO57_1011802 [Entomophthora muscae]
MVFNSNIFDSTSNQASSSQGSFNGGKAQNVEAHVYTQAFEEVNKEADLYLYLTPNPYGFDLFNSHFAPSATPAPVPTPAQAACQPTNQDDNLDLEQLPAISQPVPHVRNGNLDAHESQNMEPEFKSWTKPFADCQTHRLGTQQPTTN